MSYKFDSVIYRTSVAENGDEDVCFVIVTKLQGESSSDEMYDEIFHTTTVRDDLSLELQSNVDNQREWRNTYYFSSWNV